VVAAATVPRPKIMARVKVKTNAFFIWLLLRLG
jgi:hypothetical protein